MALTFPTVLSGDNLGQRHHSLNSQVNQVAASGQVPFEDIEVLPEQSAVDRLFKIDLANKLKNYDYILKNLKDDDMLYVSRALKCKWLLERREIINPKYLEDDLYPQMVMPAVSKLKHWLYINLTDPVVCQEFYEYYKNTKFDYAVKFLSHCDNEFLLNEFPKILLQVTPHILKVLGEKCPKLFKIYFDSLAMNKELVKRYLREEQIFFNSTKSLLKSDPGLYLDITEKYHPLASFNRFSPVATKFILRHHKSRFMAKSELYIAHLLHMPTVAQQLSVEECQELVIKLARAEYLSWWFSYANVEPLVKRVSPENRSSFKKKVFVKKDIGERVTEWPYALPASPENDQSFTDSHVFQDQDYDPIHATEHDFGGYDMKKCMRSCAAACYMSSDCRILVKSELQKLFDEFRVVGFEATLHELQRRIGATSSADRRRDMLLVLVSKSGGRPDSVRTVLQLAMKFRNEPVHERAAIVRSLVKRANAWRFSQDVWDLMLEYAQGLGLDGTQPEAQCREGLHAVVLRQLLATGDCQPAVRAAFLDDFSSLEEYKLFPAERSSVAIGLQNILMAAASNAKVEVAARYLNHLLDVFKKYRIPFQTAVSPVAALAERDSEIARTLLVRLYKARVGRRELLRQYLEFRHDDAALLNVLRHDPDALKCEWLVKLLTDRETSANQFFLKVVVYFNETGGIADQVRRTLQDQIVKTPDVKLARPLATLARDLQTIWQEQDLVGGEHAKFASALRANMHRARPAPDALALGWRKAGMKAVAWRVVRCRQSEVTQFIQILFQERVKRTVRIALLLAQRTACAADIYSTAVTIRPLAALRAAFSYYRSLGKAADPRVWDIVKDLVSNVDLISRKGLRHVLKKVEWLPSAIKPNYCAVLCPVLDKISDRDARDIRLDLMKCLPEVNDDLLKVVILQMLSKIDGDDPESFPAIVIRYLMLSKSSDEEKLRFEEIGQPFLTQIDKFRKEDDELRFRFFKDNLDQIMTSLQYNSAFFDIKYNSSLVVIERILTWMSNFLPKEKHFERYINIHITMLYLKAIRQSMKQRPEIFADPAKKMLEGVDIVGFTFGRYVVKELAELKSTYFDSVVELYQNAFTDYLIEYFSYGASRPQFIKAVMRGMLSENVGSEARLAVEVLHAYQYDFKDSVIEEIKELCMTGANKEVQFFAHAAIFT